MFIIKGFAPHAAFFNNAEHVVNPIGEISSLSNTFAKDKGLYANRQISDSIAVKTFECQENNVTKVMPNAVRDQILEIIKFVYDYTINQPGIQVDHAELVTALITQFGSVAKDINAGAIVSDGQFFVPEYVGWKQGTEATVTIWMADAAFQAQYPNYEITVISPIWSEGAPYPIDGFFRPGAEVEQMLRDMTMTEMAERMQMAKDLYPETYMSIPAFDYHDPQNVSRVVPSYWGILVYGAAGNNLDSIKDAIQDFILSNSNHSRDEWANILPDIFKRTEFMLVPNWGKMSVPDTQAEKGIYNSVMSDKEINALLKRIVTGYQATQINNYGTMTGWPWRSLAMCIVGNYENRDAKFRIDDVYPDWISVASTSPDFGRMSLRTRKWFEKIQEMVFLAETFKEFDVPPAGVTRIVRNNRLYLAASIENIHYLVLCKINF